MSTKQIELKSVKLPRHYRSFQATVNPKHIRELRLKIDAYNRVEVRKILPINGKIQEMARSSEIFLKEATQRFQTHLILNKPPINLDEIIEDMERLCKSEKLNSLTLSIISVTFDVSGDAYYFENHKPSKALTLKTINGKLIGKITEIERDALLNGRLKFAAPSTCTKIYKEEWKCV